MSLLSFSQATAPRLPVKIRWPLGTATAALPATRQTTPAGIVATYHTIADLQRTIYLLSMVQEAADLGGIVEQQPEQIGVTI